jgi:hypothetical protein
MSLIYLTYWVVRCQETIAMRSMITAPCRDRVQMLRSLAKRILEVGVLIQGVGYSSGNHV